MTIKSLYEIDKVLSELTEKEYEEMRMNARNISKQLREGYYTKKALDNSLSILDVL